MSNTAFVITKVEPNRVGIIPPYQFSYYFNGETNIVNHMGVLSIDETGKFSVYDSPDNSQTAVTAFVKGEFCSTEFVITGMDENLNHRVFELVIIDNLIVRVKEEGAIIYFDSRYQLLNENKFPIPEGHTLEIGVALCANPKVYRNCWFYYWAKEELWSTYLDTVKLRGEPATQIVAEFVAPEPFFPDPRLSSILSKSQLTVPEFVDALQEDSQKGYPVVTVYGENTQESSPTIPQGKQMYRAVYFVLLAFALIFSGWLGSIAQKDYVNKSKDSCLGVHNTVPCHQLKIQQLLLESRGVTK